MLSWDRAVLRDLIVERPRDSFDLICEFVPRKYIQQMVNEARCRLWLTAKTDCIRQARNQIPMSVWCMIFQYLTLRDKHFYICQEWSCIVRSNPHCFAHIEFSFNYLLAGKSDTIQRLVDSNNGHRVSRLTFYAHNQNQHKFAMLEQCIPKLNPKVQITLRVDRHSIVTKRLLDLCRSYPTAIRVHLAGVDYVDLLPFASSLDMAGEIQPILPAESPLRYLHFHSQATTAVFSWKHVPISLTELFFVRGNMSDPEQFVHTHLREITLHHIQLDSLALLIRSTKHVLESLHFFMCQWRLQNDEPLTEEAKLAVYSQKNVEFLTELSQCTNLTNFELMEQDQKKTDSSLRPEFLLHGDGTTNRLFTSLGHCRKLAYVCLHKNIAVGIDHKMFQLLPRSLVRSHFSLATDFNTQVLSEFPNLLKMDKSQLPEPKLDEVYLLLQKRLDKNYFEEWF